MNDSNDIIEFIVDANDSGTRIDKYISLLQENLTRSYLQKLIQDEMVFVNNKIIKSNYKVSTGDCISISLPAPKELSIEAEDIPLDIIFEDQDIIVINKAKGMVVHPAAGHFREH